MKSWVSGVSATGGAIIPTTGRMPLSCGRITCSLLGPDRSRIGIRNLQGGSSMAGLILGIETSCDETAAAVVAGGRQILSNVISSQIELHRPFGGVVPELASRNHLENISLI